MVVPKARAGPEQAGARPGAGPSLWPTPRLAQGRNRAGAGPEQGQSRAGAGPEQGRDRAGAGPEQGQSWVGTGPWQGCSKAETGPEQSRSRPEQGQEQGPVCGRAPKLENPNGCEVLEPDLQIYL